MDTKPLGLLDFATVTPMELDHGQHHLMNLVGGHWRSTRNYLPIVDPVYGRTMYLMPDTEPDELEAFLTGIRSVPTYGLHNPLNNLDRHKLLAGVCLKAGFALSDPRIADYFARLIQRVMPKSYIQCWGEVTVVCDFLLSYAGDQIRFLSRGRTTPGDHQGQEARDYRWPFGGVAIVSPFNFPLEIGGLQLLGSLFMGNRPTIKAASTVAVVMEQFIRLLIACGLPPHDVDLLHCPGSTMENFLTEAGDAVRVLQFTGSSEVSEHLAHIVGGRIKAEDSGFNPKILWRDVPPVGSPEFNYVVGQCDQDAYAASGQKCSAQSLLFVHDAWVQSGFYAAIRDLAEGRNFSDLTVGPVLSMTTNEILDHRDLLLQMPGARLLFGGKSLDQGDVPEKYGMMAPTAVFVPLSTIVDPQYFDVVTKEIFGPFQVVTEYSDDELPVVLDLWERIPHRLTAAVVSDDPVFTNLVLSRTNNGTTYAGRRARTTGAPEWHQFGPCGDPRAAGIGSPENIMNTWSGQRTIISDVGPIYPETTIVQS